MKIRKSDTNSLTLALAAGGLGLALLTGCASGPDGAALLSSRCTSCHTLTLVATNRQSAADWDSTVTNMMLRGAQLSKTEKATLVDYLAQTYGP